MVAQASPIPARWLVAAVFVAGVMGAISAPSQVCPELVGRVPYGPTRAVAADGNHVYYGSGSVLMIADATIPAAPVVMGELQLPGLIQDIEVENGFAHVVCGVPGYVLVDVADPSAPEIAGSFVTGPFPGWAFAGGVTVSGSLVFVADGSPGLTILDVSQPGNIQYVSEADVLNSYYVTVREPYVYVTGYDGIRIVDVSNPSSPVVAARSFEEGYGLDVVGDYAYVGGSMDGLRVYDVTTPGALVQINLIGSLVGAVDVAAANGHLYVATGYRLDVMDLVDPVSPSTVGKAVMGAIKVAVDGDQAYASCHSSGLRIVDVSVPATPVEVAVLATPGWTLSVAASDSLMFAPGGNDEVRVFDTTDPADPVQISVAVSDGPFWDLEAVGDALYVANASSLRWIDVSDPLAPFEIGSNGNGARGFDVAGDRLYIASSADRFEVFDISQPTSPAFQGRLMLPDSAHKVAVTSGHAYVAVWDHGLQIIDVSTPGGLSVVGAYGGVEYFSDVAASDSHVFVVGSGDLRILDVTTPASPIEVAIYDVGSGVRSVDVAGQYAYLGREPMTVLDIADPSSPVAIGALDPTLAPGDAEQVKVVGDMVYVAHYIGGVSIVRGCHTLFVDGFESGGVGDWSSSQGAAP
jgi:hypothetical protein